MTISRGTGQDIRKELQEVAKRNRIDDTLKPMPQLIQEVLTGGNAEYYGQRLAYNIVQTMLDAGMLRNCLNCDHWQDSANNTRPEGCSLYKQLPPPKVIVVGCPKHTDIIPF